VRVSQHSQNMRVSTSSYLVIEKILLLVTLIRARQASDLLHMFLRTKERCPPIQIVVIAAHRSRQTRSFAIFGL
jgi:hypothetical protein